MLLDADQSQPYGRCRVYLTTTACSRYYFKVVTRAFPVETNPLIVNHLVGIRAQITGTMEAEVVGKNKHLLVPHTLAIAVLFIGAMLAYYMGFTKEITVIVLFGILLELGAWAALFRNYW